MLIRGLAGLSGACFALAHAAAAQSVGLTEDTLEFSATVNGQSVVISRIQDGENALTGPYALTSRPCPGSCLQPVTAAPGVAPAAELEVLAFLRDQAATGRGLLIDTREPSAFTTGAIPGAVNVPSATLEASNPFRNEILKALGATQDGSGGQWDFSGALNLLFYCDGPWCASAPDTVRGLVAAGYPAAKLSYYRGGMQSWHLMGLNVQ